MKSKVSEVNLEHGQPTAAAALAHLEAEIRGAKIRGVKVLRVIHGYGSTGKGGKIRIAVRKALPAMLASSSISAFVFGDDYDIFNAAAMELRQKYPELDRSFADDRGNPGITLVVL